jgi:hypothetical protein
MTERRIDPAHDNPRKFAISTAPELLGDFPDQDEILVVLAEELVSTHSVFYKPIPSKLKNLKYNEKKVRWLNNFGIKEKGAKEYAKRVTHYRVHLKHIAGAVYVYYDGAAIKLLEVTDPEAGMVSALLDLGDPPLGWVK